MKIDTIKNGKELKKWRLSYPYKNRKSLPRHVFAAEMGMAIGTIQTIENEGLTLEDNFKIILSAKYKK